MTIKVIIEFQAKPGQRAEVRSLSESIVEDLGPGEIGYLGGTYYEVLGNPDLLIEIAEWESPEMRAAAVQKATDTGVYAPLLEKLATPVKATVIRQLP
jgi:quinol monooxygenase YgiN